MKKIIFLVIAATLCGSCESWLDVNPKSQTKQEHLFRNEAGFRSALLGVYLDMGEEELYGGNLTLGFTDVLAQYYNIPTSDNPFYPAAQYDYGSSDVQATISDVWSKAYNCIVNLNNMLEQLEKKPSGFFSDERYYGILKGEAKALRAMLHFDLLRLIGPSPVTGMDAKAIPFVDKVSKTPFETLTVREVLTRCMAELEEASDLLYKVDPISPFFEEYTDEQIPTGGVNNQNSYINDSGFFLDRKMRMNWLAVRGLLARTALYAGKTTEAAEYAKECLDTERFSVDEDIFTLHVDILYLYTNKYLNPASTNMQNGLAVSVANKAYFYETSKIGSDTRPVNYFTSADSNFDIMSRFTRKMGDQENPSRLPMLSGSEIYLIYAECAASETDRYSYINQERRQFNIMGSDELTPSKDPDLKAEIAKEYRKRFIGEGQFFYFMKRNDVTSVSRANEEVIKIDAARVYTMMDYLPENEYNYGKIGQ
ncbi:RagB/SusD family nutrient uptake outer membrane protein [Alistipes sp. OttesenSCG-928-B03]|nr:RagB/SusD family nutrient uptake outer membrane protein [Alistipes sp. OttesenSCG-928-B03]